MQAAASVADGGGAPQPAAQGSAGVGAAPTGAPAQPAIVAPPIFLSGSHHREYVYGSDVQPAAVVIADLTRKLAARKARGHDGRCTRDARGAKKPPAVKPVTMRDLLDAGYMQAGEDTVTVAYKGTTYRATMLPSGQIEYNGQLFDAPSAFSVYVKRLQTPHKQGDDGWRSVHVDGVALEEHRQKLLVQRNSIEAAAAAQAAAIPKKLSYALEAPLSSPYMQQLPEGALPVLPSAFDVEIPKEPEPDAAQEGGAEGEEGGEEEPDTNNWVQCSRCQTWRVVPDEFWPDIEAADEEDWYCEEATWDLTQYDPHTPGCKSNVTS